MRRTSQASKPSSPVFGMRFLTEEDLKFAVVGCLSTSPTAPTGRVDDSGASATIRLCGDGGDTDFAPADDAVESIR